MELPDIMLEYFRQIDPLWVSLAPVVVVNVYFLTVLSIFAVKRKNLPKDQEVQERHASRFLSVWFREYWVYATQPILKLLVKLGVNPNVLTTWGFLLSCLAGLAFSQGLMGIAGWVMIAGGTCDLFDGRIARMTNKSSESGAFYDSVMDRFGEAVVMAGLMIYYRDSWILYFLIAGLVGSLCVSYTRARGASSGVVCDGGIMQRPERIVYLGVGSIFSPLFKLLVTGGNVNAPEFITIGAICLIAVMTNLTAVYRILYIYKKLDEKHKNPVLEASRKKSPLAKKISQVFLDQFS